MTTTDTDNEPCPGPCNRQWEAAERAEHEARTAGHNPEPHNMQPIPGQPLWCAACRDEIHTQLNALPGYVNMLGSGKLNTPAADLGRLTHADNHASVSPAHDLADEAIRWAVNAEVAHREATTERVPDVRTMAQAVEYLAGHITAILCVDPDGFSFGESVRNWHRRLESATGTGSLVHRIKGQCPRCKRRGTLRRKDGGDWVVCTARSREGACPGRWEYGHWANFAKAMVRMEEAG